MSRFPHQRPPSLHVVPVADDAHTLQTGLPEQRPDARWIVQAADCSAHARCSLWWTRTPTVDGRRVGFIGHYSSMNEAGGAQLIARARRELAAHGCSLAIGPVNGSTWHPYRFVTARGNEPPFFLEPDNDDDWPQQFLRCGFQPLAGYLSALQTELSVDTRRMQRLAANTAAASIRIRCLDPRHAEDELERLHTLIQTSFRSSLLYTPLTAEQFVRLHAPLLGHIRPELVLVAEQAGSIVALLFALPDIAQAQRGIPIDTVIVKTVAAMPGRRYAGLAHLLASHAAQIAQELGYRRAIHALMRESIESANWSARHGTPIRRYTLYASHLDP